MKTLFLLVISLVLVAGAQAQTPEPHDVDLTWIHSPDFFKKPGTFYHIYRLKVTGTDKCDTKSVSTTTTGFTNIGMSLTNGYTDKAVSGGVYCYTVRAVLDTAESINSNGAIAIVPSFNLKTKVRD